MLFKPMLAPSKNLTQERFEGAKRVRWVASEKMDGIRCLLGPDGPYTRNGKEIPNQQLRIRLEEIAADLLKSGVTNLLRQPVLDGELWSPDLDFHEISGCVRAHDRKIPETLSYWVFDIVSTGLPGDRICTMPFDERLDWVDRYCLYLFWRRSNNFIKPIHQHRCISWQDVLGHFEDVLSKGGEGLIVRNLDKPYKQGRCTATECNMFKLKACETCDGKVIGLQPLKRSLDRETDAFGYSKTLRDQGSLYETDYLGSFLVEMEDGTQVSVGSGFTDAQRKLYNNPEYVGRWIEFKHMKAGSKDKPRFPVFVRLREDKE